MGTSVIGRPSRVHGEVYPPPSPQEEDSGLLAPRPPPNKHLVEHPELQVDKHMEGHSEEHPDGGLD